jgi:Protein kinase domain/Cyclic nucleotide-binding domain
MSPPNSAIMAPLPMPPDQTSWNVFRGCQAFATLPRTTIEEMFGSVEERRYAAGDALLRQGDPADGLLVLIEGTARATLREEGGHRVGVFTTGDIVGEMALVTREPRTADVIANSPVRALLLPVAAFELLAARHLELCVLLTNLVADRLGQGAHDGLGGKAVDGYRIVRCVGRGGMAVVYRAEDQKTGEVVALKMMSHRLVYDPTALARFRQEAEVLQGLDHENIARLDRTFAAYNTLFLVMEFCDGADLARLIRARRRLPESQVRRILGQLACALDHVHRKGLVHRDLKPGNVMVDRLGTVKLMDFGLATPGIALGQETMARTMTSTGILMGTPAYMAPEQIAGAPLDARADIYAMACLAYGLLTGQQLFRATNFLDLVQDKLTLRLPAARDIGDGISDELHVVLDHALRRDRTERLSSVACLTAWAGPVDLPALNDPSPQGAS